MVQDYVFLRIIQNQNTGKTVLHMCLHICLCTQQCQHQNPILTSFEEVMQVSSFYCPAFLFSQKNLFLRVAKLQQVLVSRKEVPSYFKTYCYWKTAKHKKPLALLWYLGWNKFPSLSIVGLFSSPLCHQPQPLENSQQRRWEIRWIHNKILSR